MKLTIGMACYDDYDGVYFTIQALRLYHNLEDTEILIIDNKGDKRLEDWVKAWTWRDVTYKKFTDVTGTTQPRQKVFEWAKGEYVICIDSHVLLMPGSLDRLWKGDDLIHGIMYYDCLETPVTHMRDEWRADMWGVWGCVDPIPGEPFEIPMHGLGLFGCKKEAWLGFNPEFKGFGGEEGYIHEKFRQAGRKVLCLPWIKWVHEFRDKAPYPLSITDRVRNYLLGFKELNLDPKPIYDHFGYRMVDTINANLTDR
ncbi:MAG: glycosyltransferase family 2 protein [Candidatus Hodarchaeota archaeon]